MTLDELRAQATLEEGSFRAWDTMAVELEVAELLYALVRQMKPLVVVEAGSGKGYSTRFIAEAILANANAGRLYSYEPDALYAELTLAALQAAPYLLPAIGAVAHSTAHDGLTPDLVFVDSLGDYRDRDIDHWFSYRNGCGHPDPLIVVHDANGYTNLPGVGIHLSAGRGVWIGHA